MKKVTAEIFFNAWGEEKQTREFDSEKEFEKFITDLKKIKDSIDCAANGVKSLWKRKGTMSDCKTPMYYSVLAHNKSTAILKYSATIK